MRERNLRGSRERGRWRNRGQWWREEVIRGQEGVAGRGWWKIEDDGMGWKLEVRGGATRKGVTTQRSGGGSSGGGGKAARG